MPRFTSAAHLILALAAGCASAQWEAAPAFPPSQTGRQYAIGLNVGGLLYALGGTPWTNGGDQDGSVHTMPSGGSAWTTRVGFDGIGGFIRQGGGVDDTGQILVFGGFDPFDPEGDPPDPFHYDIIDGPGGGLAPRGAGAPNDLFAWCTDGAGRVYSLGGGPGPAAHSGDPNTGYGERYIGTANAWEVIAPMPTPAADACAVVDSGSHILVIGGYDATATTRLTNVARYDIAAGTWSDSAVPDLPVGLTGARAVLGSDDRVWVMGGKAGPVSSGTIVATCYVLDADGSAWHAGPDMAEARMWFGAALGDDDHVYVMGGVTPAGGTDSCEKIYTTPCPIFATEPADTIAWTGQPAAFRVAAIGGGTISYRWFRDGVALDDGPTGTGSELTGTRTETLHIENVGPADAGRYSAEATNSCGTTASGEGELIVRETPTLPDAWTVTNLHPAWATEGSTVYGVQSGEQVGGGQKIIQLYGQDYVISRPVIWHGDASSAVDVTPAGSVGGGINATNGQVQAGWWWWPYTCQQGTCYTRQAARWHGDAASHENLQASGWEYSSAACVSDVQIGGSIQTDDDSGNTWYHAALWPTEGARHPADLHPSGARSSSISEMDGGYQYGSVLTEFPFGFRAARWEGTRGSYVDMHPAAASESYFTGAGDGQQVGVAEIGGVNRPVLWHGSPDDFIELQPPGASAAGLTDCEGGLQLGNATFADGAHPVLWAGRADRYADLRPFLPAEFLTAYATAMDVEPDGTIVVVGYGTNQSTGVFNALMWRSVACAADFNGDGGVNTLDVLAFLNAWSAGDPRGDFNGDGSINTIDVLAFLNAWSAGC